MARSRKRRGRRIRIRHPAFFQLAEQSGSGTLVEISYSGARIRAADVRATRADPVALYVWPANESEPVELRGSVARVFDDGFAMEYGRTGQEIVQWVDALEVAAASDESLQGEEAEEAEGAA